MGRTERIPKLLSHQVKSLSCVRLCDPMDCSLPRSFIHEIFQARVLGWVAISFSWGSSRPRDRTRVSCTVGTRFTVWATVFKSPNEFYTWKLTPSGLNKLVWVQWCLSLITASYRCLWRRKGQPTLVFWPGKFHGQRNLVGLSMHAHGLNCLYRITFSLILPDPHPVTGHHCPLFRDTPTLKQVSQPNLSAPEPGRLSPRRNPLHLAGLTTGSSRQAILNMPVRTDLLLPPHSCCTWLACLLSTFFALHNSDRYICWLGYVISPFETQDVCPLSFLFWAVPNREPLHKACTWYYLLWEDGVWLEECLLLEYLW